MHHVTFLWFPFGTSRPISRLLHNRALLLPTSDSLSLSLFSPLFRLPLPLLSPITQTSTSVCRYFFIIAAHLLVHPVLNLVVTIVTMAGRKSPISSRISETPAKVFAENCYNPALLDFDRGYISTASLLFAFQDLHCNFI